MHPSRHNLGKSEAGQSALMLPGYAAIRLSPKRRPTLRASLLLGALGVLPVVGLLVGVFRPGF